MRTPKPGDRLSVHRPEHLGTTPIVTVTQVYTSLDEDWGEDGPVAWEMRDVLEREGKTADWFAFVHDEDDDQLTTCLASFEAELVE